VASRIGLRANGMRFARADDLLALIDADIAENGKLDCVLVDEAQFLSKAQVWQLSDVVDKRGIPVLCYGLRTDFRGELFEGSQYLLAWADNLRRSRPSATRDARRPWWCASTNTVTRCTDGPQVEIGGNERYVSVSRAEFKKIVAGEGSIEPLQSPLPL
jgi:thymidine kinase